ncbi:MAG TPA: hypothetical protein VGP50_18150 [Stellaceae bacterium]|nr:hypothetical protein [Stellaceae bacterium]
MNESANLPDDSASDRLRRRVDEAFADLRPNVPAADVFKRLREQDANRK